MKRAGILIIICCLIGGCSGLMLKERERALDEAFEKGRINDVQYRTSERALEREKAQGTPGTKYLYDYGNKR